MVRKGIGAAITYWLAPTEEGRMSRPIFITILQSWRRPEPRAKGRSWPGMHSSACEWMDILIACYVLVLGRVKHGTERSANVRSVNSSSTVFSNQRFCSKDRKTWFDFERIFPNVNQASKFQFAVDLQKPDPILLLLVFSLLGLLFVPLLATGTKFSLACIFDACHN